MSSGWRRTTTFKTSTPTSRFRTDIRRNKLPGLLSVVPRLIIGVDPGLASTGWGLIEFFKGRLRHVAHGCIETRAETPRAERILFIYNSFLKVLKIYKPHEAAMENLYFGRNVTSAMAVAEARGVLLLALSKQAIPALELTPNEIKKAVVGVTKAEKSQLQEMARLILGLKEIPKPDHAADALGAAICAAHTGGGAGSVPLAARGSKPGVVVQDVPSPAVYRGARRAKTKT